MKTYHGVLVLDAALLAAVSYMLYTIGIEQWVLAFPLFLTVAVVLFAQSVLQVKREGNTKTPAAMLLPTRIAGACFIWLLLPPANWLGYGVIVLGFIFMMPPLVLRTTFYTYVGFIALSLWGLEATFANVHELFAAELHYFTGLAVLQRVLSIGLAAAIVWAIVTKRPFEKSWYVLLIGVMTVLTTPISVAIAAVVYGVYNALYSQTYRLLNVLRFKNRVVGNSKEHYLVTYGPEQFKAVVHGGFRSAGRYYKKQLQSIAGAFKGSTSKVFALYQAVFIAVYVCANAIVRTLSILGCGLVHGLVLYTAKAVFDVTKWLYYESDARFRKRHAIRLVCGSCYTEHELPDYHCPHCGAKHQLVPNVFGIRKRRCKCGTKINNRYQTGRHLLSAACPTCSAAYMEDEATTIVLPLIGAQSVGKTSFMVHALEHLKETTLPATGGMATYSRPQIAEQVQLYRQATTMPHTTSEAPASYTLQIERAQQVPLNIQTFDVAGHHYEDFDKMKMLHFLKHANGYIVLLNMDLLTSANKVAAEDTLDRLLMYCQQELSDDLADRVAMPVAFVFTKADRQAEQLAHHDDIKRWLHDIDMQHLVRKMDMSFTTYRFFTSSVKEAGAHNEPQQAYIWLLSQQQPKLFKGGLTHV